MALGAGAAVAVTADARDEDGRLDSTLIIAPAKVD
jgi:hypothetical protein